VILAIETATTAASVALVDGDVVIAEAAVAKTRRHTEVLLGLVDEVLDRGGVALNDLSALACDLGPGLFTGLRVGVAVTQGFAVALGLEVIPVTSLYALATVASGERAALVDARRGEVFVQRFTGTAAEPEALTEPLVVAPNALVQLLDAHVTIVGDGGAAAADVLRLAGRAVPEEGDVPHARAIGLLAAQRDPATRVHPSLLRPLYLRDADAKVNFTVRREVGE
jgi:tRNA threonylcarbamoyladenosine biosynthesis protein TsaB